MRAFMGIALPDAVRSSLVSLQRQVGESGADVKWVEAGNLHVTLKFLDEITEEQRRPIEAMLSRVVAQETPFTVTLVDVGAFPSMKAPRVMWVGIKEGKETIVRIAQRIERECQALGLRSEERPFAAHVTLGRVRSLRRRNALAQQLQQVSWQPPAPWRVTSVTLYYSVLSSTGPHYTVLAEVPLAPQRVDSP